MELKITEVMGIKEAAWDTSLLIALDRELEIWYHKKLHDVWTDTQDRHCMRPVVYSDPDTVLVGTTRAPLTQEQILALINFAIPA